MYYSLYGAYILKLKALGIILSHYRAIFRLASVCVLLVMQGAGKLSIDNKISAVLSRT